MLEKRPAPRMYQMFVNLEECEVTDDGLGHSNLELLRHCLNLRRPDLVSVMNSKQFINVDEDNELREPVIDE